MVAELVDDGNMDESARRNGKSYTLTLRCRANCASSNISNSELRSPSGALFGLRAILFAFELHTLLEVVAEHEVEDGVDLRLLLLPLLLLLLLLFEARSEEG